MLIISDLDGVGAEMDEGLRARWRSEYPHLEIPDAFLSWDWHKEISKDHTTAFNTILGSEGFFGALQEVEGWSAAMNKLLDDGHDVLIGTTPWHSSPSCHQDKIEWVSRIAGRRWRERVMQIPDKTIIDADILIDDKPVIRGRNTGPRRAYPSWTQVWFDQPYNRGIEGHRIENWTDGTWETVLYGLEGEM